MNGRKKSCENNKRTEFQFVWILRFSFETKNPFDGCVGRCCCCCRIYNCVGTSNSFECVRMCACLLFCTCVSCNWRWSSTETFAAEHIGHCAIVIFSSIDSVYLFKRTLFIGFVENPIKFAHSIIPHRSFGSSLLHTIRGNRNLEFGKSPKFRGWRRVRPAMRCAVCIIPSIGRCGPNSVIYSAINWRILFLNRWSTRKNHISIAEWYYRYVCRTLKTSDSIVVRFIHTNTTIWTHDTVDTVRLMLGKYLLCAFNDTSITPPTRSFFHNILH